MHAGQPSRTARGVALLRAVHQLLDQPQVFVDPLAVKILGHETEARLLANPRCVRSNAQIRAAIAVRSRYAEDMLAQAVAGGVRQYVILGAGLDTFAYRNPHTEIGLRVFEVDHPATQAWKRQCLRGIGMQVPEWLSFVPVDFATDTLDHGLKASGFREDHPAFMSMLGLVIFMPQPTVMEMLNFAASLSHGGGIAFDYGAVESYLEPNQRAQRQAVVRQAAATGEPYLTFLDPRILAADLRQMGFSNIDDCGSEEINRCYFGDRSDGLCVGPGGRRLIGARR